ncbi:hypothetical protein ACFQJC_08620 [Haloferax namakaokahaiae]|uniref:Capsule polysaccharide biosynthesis protein n=1 Tax=Haloferax namakaokahaiae TaxID=1748331 RepID=A0ABD5ZF63_9EURY
MTEFKKTALKLVEKAGLGTEALRIYDTLFDYTGVVDPSVRSFEDHAEKKGTVVFPLIPGYRTMCLRYCILADAFRRRGYNPVLIVDDVTEAPVERSVDDDVAISIQTSYFEQAIPKKFGLETTKLSELLSSELVNLSDESPIIDRYDIRRFALGSTRRRLKRYTIDLDDTNVVNEYNRFLSLGVLLAKAFEHLIENHTVELVVVHEDYYIQGGVPMAVAREHDIKAYSQGFGFREGTLIFGGQSERSTLPHFTSSEVVNQALQNPLTPDEKAAIDDVVFGRESGDGMPVAYSANTGRTVTADDRHSVGMFTNLLWDASLEPENALYADVFDWIADTIDEFEGRTDAELIIKTHPAEAKYGTEESVTERVTNELGPLPKNVHLLPPDTDVDTYALMSGLDAVVVYNSTVGLESAYRDLPVIVAGETHYRGFGFTIDPKTKSEYLEMVAEEENIEKPPESAALAQRYANLLFRKRHTDFPFFTRDVTKKQRFKKVTSDDTSPGSEPLESLLSSLLAGEEVVHD